MGTAPRRPGEAAASHRGGRLRGGARLAAAAGALGGSLLQVTVFPLAFSTSLYHLPRECLPPRDELLHTCYICLKGGLTVKRKTSND